MTTIEAAQREIDKLLAVTEADLNRRGVLMLTRAQDLLNAVKQAQQGMALCERTTPTDYFNAHWSQQKANLADFRTQLTRMIDGVVVPADDHEAAPKQSSYA